MKCEYQNVVINSDYKIENSRVNKTIAVVNTCTGETVRTYNEESINWQFFTLTSILFFVLFMMFSR